MIREHFSFKTFRNIKGNSHSLLDNIIYAIAQDKNSGKLWIGSRSGVSILEDESGDGNFTNIVRATFKEIYLLMK